VARLLQLLEQHTTDKAGRSCNKALHPCRSPRSLKNATNPEQTQ
jgi:hypothetical protein